MLLTVSFSKKRKFYQATYQYVNLKFAQENIKQQKQHLLLLLPLLNRFYRDYRWMLFLANAANSQLINRLFFTAVFANLPFNLVLVGNLFFLVANYH